MPKIKKDTNTLYKICVIFVKIACVVEGVGDGISS